MQPASSGISGTLYIVSTPIGNLGDISPRAIDTLKEVSKILCEDTRTFRTLATRFGIEVPTESFHDHNEAKRVPQIIEALLAGTSIALVSDAGTPLISDPGYRLVRACVENGIRVCPLPGPSACLAALVGSGFEIHKYCFAGFPPRKPGPLARFLQEFLDLQITFVIYESPFRVIKTLEKLVELAPTRDACVARELTKMHEEFLRGTAREILANLTARTSVKGECVIVVRGIQTDMPESEDETNEEEMSSR